MTAAPPGGADLKAPLMTIVGLDEKNANDAAKNADRAASVLEFFASKLINESSPRELKARLYTIFSKAKTPFQRSFVADYVISGKLKRAQQVDAACKFISSLPQDVTTVDVAAFEQASGVGQEISAAQTDQIVLAELQKIERAKLADIFRRTPGQLIGLMRKVDALRWAEADDIKRAIDAHVPQIVEGAVGPPEPSCQKPRDSTAVEQRQMPRPAASSAEGARWAMVDDFTKVNSENLTRTRLNEVAQVPDGTRIFFEGWAHRVRHQSRMSFVVVRDGYGFVQVVFGGKIPQFSRETSLAIRGIVKDEPKARTGLQPAKEVHVEQWAIISESDPDIENVVTSESGIDTLFDQRHITLRGEHASTVIRVRSAVIQSFREHFLEQHLTEVTPPTMVQMQVEGGATLFALDFYGEPAYMTQSSQLYLETCLPVVGDCFCVMPSYRAENQKTRRHLAEFTHIEGEYAYLNFDDLLTRLEAMVTDVVGKTLLKVGPLIAHENPEMHIQGKDPTKPSSFKFFPPDGPLFKRLKYADAIKLCNDSGILSNVTGKPFEYGEDITEKPEREMVKLIGQPVMLVDFPAEMKSFYMSRCATDNSLTESVDILAPGVGEIVGGSMRSWKYEELMRSFNQQKLDPKNYYWYTDLRKYGSVPHGGFGLGLERFVMWLLNLESIREACLYPRMLGRCFP